MLTVLFLLLSTCTLGCFSRELVVEEKLLNYIFANYSPESRPEPKPNEPLKATNVTLEFMLIKILKVDEDRQAVDTSGWLKLSWKDDRLKWRPNDFGGLTKLRVPTSKLWYPDIVLYNSMENYKLSRKYKSVIDFDGSVMWIPPVQLKSTCRMNFRYFPFDHHNCTYKFGSWTYDSLSIFLILQNSNFFQNYEANGQWNITSSYSVLNTVVYPCCPEAYQDVTYTIRLKRNSSAYCKELVLPSICLTILSLMAFYLPPSSKGKITLGMTSFLALSVFMLLLAKRMPISGEATPILGIYMASVMILVTVSVILSVFVLKIHDKGFAECPVPKIIRFLFFDVLAYIVCMRSAATAIKKKRKNLELDTEHQMKHNVEQEKSLNFHGKDPSKCRFFKQKKQQSVEWRLLAAIVDKYLFLILSTAAFVFTLKYVTQIHRGK